MRYKVVKPISQGFKHIGAKILYNKCLLGFINTSIILHHYQNFNTKTLNRLDSLATSILNLMCCIEFFLYALINKNSINKMKECGMILCINTQIKHFLCVLCD